VNDNQEPQRPSKKEPHTDINNENALDVFKPSAIPSEVDDRDYPFPRAKALSPTALPRRFLLPEDPADNQMDRGTCMIFTAEDIARNEARRSLGVLFDPSEEYGYARYNELDGTLGQDNGAFPRDAMAQVCEGILLESLRPYRSTPLSQGTTEAERAEAAKRHAVEYVLCNTQFDEMAAIFESRYVALCLTIMRNFVPDAQGYVPLPDRGAGIWGGHAMRKTGWDLDMVHNGFTGFWRCKNQWSQSWGDRGYFWIPMQIDNLRSVYDSNDQGGTWHQGAYTLNGFIDQTIPQPQPEPNPQPQPTPDLKAKALQIAQNERQRLEDLYQQQKGTQKAYARFRRDGALFVEQALQRDENWQ
jgi:C1A family cysteine protease